MNRIDAFAAGTMIGIGVACGLCIALFAVVDGLWRPLPFPAAERLVHLEAPAHVFSAVPNEEIQRIEKLVDATTLIEGRSSARPSRALEDFSEARREWGLRPQQVTPEFFALFGARPHVGRLLERRDISGAGPINAVIGYRVWQSVFQGNPQILDHEIQIPGTTGDRRWRIVGVMAEGFEFPLGANVWIGGSGSVPTPPRIPTYARLADGVSFDSLRSQLPGITVTPLREHLRPGSAFGLALVLGAAVLLLMVAAAQSAMLHFARADDGERDSAVRKALGASRLDLARHIGADLFGVAVGALIIGVATSLPLSATVTSLLPGTITLGRDVELGWRAVAFGAILVAGIYSALFAVMVLNASRVRPSGALLTTRNHLATTRAGRTHRLIGDAQIAVTVALLYVMALVILSDVKLRAVSLGFEPDRLYAVRIPVPTVPRGLEPEESARRRELNRARLELSYTTLRSHKGIVSVSGGASWPMQVGYVPAVTLSAEAGGERGAVEGRFTFVMPDYWKTVGGAITEGYDVGPAGGDGLTQAVVNATLARHLSRFGDPVGQIVAQTESLRYRVVGVSADMPFERLERPTEPMLFAYAATPVPLALVRLRDSEAGTLAAVRDSIAAIWDGAQPNVVPISRVVQEAGIDHHARAILLLVIAGFALPVTAIGLAASQLWLVRRQSRRFAIELALGADSALLSRRMLMTVGLRMAGACSTGLLAGILAANATKSVLYGVASVSAGAVTAIFVFTAIVVAATTVPSLRALRLIDPAELLRTL